VLLWIRSVLVTGLLVTTLVYTALSPFFNINRIIVKGAAHYDHQTLIAASGIYEGENGFRKLFDKPGKFYFLRIGSAEKAIMNGCPYVESVKARFIIPSTVTLEVKEREAAAILSMAGTSLLIDKEGYLLEINPDVKKLDLPVIKGIKPDTYKPGKKTGIQEDVLLTAFTVLDTIKEIDTSNTVKLLPSVDYVDVGNIDKVSISLQSRVIVNFGGLEDLHYKINAVQTIFTKNINKKERGKLDFSSDGNPVFTPENGG
jgi:hypothetical protein